MTYRRRRERRRRPFKVAMSDQALRAVRGDGDELREHAVPERRRREGPRGPGPPRHVHVSGGQARGRGQLTAYGVGIRGGWSLGIGGVHRPSGKFLGQFGWRMRLGMAAPGAATTRPTRCSSRACSSTEDKACTGGDATRVRSTRRRLRGRGRRRLGRGRGALDRLLPARPRPPPARPATATTPTDAAPWRTAYDSGRRGVARDEARAFGIYDHACEHLLKPDACFRIGAAYTRGTPTSEGYARAARLFDHACAAKTWTPAKGSLASTARARGSRRTKRAPRSSATGSARRRRRRVQRPRRPVRQGQGRHQGRGARRESLQEGV